ncbi:stress-induced-phosphoprotein 1 [Periophthalmus magnuspinnatus]|uniref:stress-induced-phosphoprotein 1 n=1 Tax=Periophthalmus magnuspinnatus TaxID=409849 RepID=UPI00145B91A5|nr:stress-induced-phosphoprotein 1 [Periophthalmus magnuspinnatus]
MSKKKEFPRVTVRTPRFREGTALMRAHETMVDFIKGGAQGSFMDILGVGMYGFMQNLEVDPDRDLIYSDDEYEDEPVNEPNQAQKLKPHPQLKELDDKEAEQIKRSLEEEQKRKSKSEKNKRKKMRKKEKKQQEKEETEQNVSHEEEQGKSNFYECEDLNNEEINIDQNIIDNYKDIDKSAPDLSDKPCSKEKNDELIKEEKPVILNKEKDNPPKNIELKNPTPCIAVSVPEKKSKNKSKNMGKAQTIQNNKIKNVEVKLPKKEEFKVDKPVKIETKENTEIKHEEKKGEHIEEIVDPIVEEYAKKSKEMAAIGNRLAESGKYEMAITFFSEAIKFNPKEYKLFGNRSFCFEKMQQFEEALSDAEVSLSMEPNWIKGLFRKGKALCGLKKYYEASLAYVDVLKLDSTSQEAVVELKRAQTLHLMEMGFTWTQSNNALKTHSTLEEALEALFNGECDFSPEENGAYQLDVSQKEWENFHLYTKNKPQTKERIQLPAPVSKKQGKPEVFPVWVGSLAPTVNYVTLQEVFSRAGAVLSIKMVLEHHCAFVNYARKEDSARAIQLLNGLLLEGSPLLVRYPSRFPPGIGVSKDALTDPLTPPSLEKECFFWRTIGCMKNDCTFKHIPQNRGIDRGLFNHKLAH